MSTKITTILDTLRTKLAAAFPTRSEIPNPYSLIDNNENFLENGIGVAIRQGAQSGNVLFNNNIDARIFSIVFTNKIYRIDSDSDPIKTIEKTLLEDQVTLRKLMLKNDQLSIDESIFKIDYIGDSGINFIFDDDFSFLNLEINFTIESMEGI